MPPLDANPSERADELFDEFVERDRAGDPVDFDAFCAAHAEHENELRALKRANDVLARLLPGPLDEAREDPAAPTHALLKELLAAGPRGARYERHGEIGRGGMGVVFRVHDRELGRDLAMKIVSGGTIDWTTTKSTITPGRLDRFLDEAQITSQLDHPGIPSVHEIGIDAGGAVYYTMGLVQGDELANVFKLVRATKEGWTEHKALNVIQRVCDTMSYAHSRGVIHRDLKPSNVMVGRFGEAYVMDWGLARDRGRPDRRDLRLRGAAKPDSPVFTMDGQAIGTASYMSPEQARGDLDQMGPRSDVYAIGAMLYELLSGSRPFAAAGENPPAQTVLERLRLGPPAPLRKLAPKTAPEIVAICENAMARDVADRYANMQALSDDLRAFADLRVVRAYESGAVAEARKWVRRNTLAAAALGAFALALVAGLIVAFNADRSESEQRAADNAASRELSTQASLDEFKRWSTEFDVDDPLRPKTTANWFRWARDLVDGATSDDDARRYPGLAALERTLAEVRAGGREVPAVQRAPFPRAEELKAKREEVEWRRRMLRSPDGWSPDEVTAVKVPTEDLGTDPIPVMKRGWILIAPDRPPSFGQELLALSYSRLALDLSRDHPVKRARCLDTLAWALYRTGRFDEALRRANDAVEQAVGNSFLGPDDKPEGDRPHFSVRDWEMNFECNRVHLVREVACWTSGDEAALQPGHEADLAALERDAAEWRAWTCDDQRDRSREKRLAALVRDLTALRERLRIAERATEAPEARARWAAAIAAIRTSERYGGMILTPQLDLLPIGPGPASRLWEFAHLPTGEPPVRKPDGTFALKRTTGLVMVLIPGTGTSRPFFISKYEMATAQWVRASPNWPTGHYDDEAILPASVLSWQACEAAFSRIGGWLTFPHGAEWDVAALGGATTAYATGPTPDSLTGSAHLDWKEGDSIPEIGTLCANGFGLHDMHGGVAEWCGDGPPPGDRPIDSFGEPLKIVPERRAVRSEWYLTPFSKARSPARPPAMNDFQAIGAMYDRNGVRPARPLTQ